MSRASRNLWRKAFASNPRIPLCPLELAEPEYASLLFSKTCSSCGTRALKYMDPHLLVRFCNPCRDHWITEISPSDELFPLLPTSDLIKPPAIYTLRLEYDSVAKKLDENPNCDGWRKDRLEQMELRKLWAHVLEMYFRLLELEKQKELSRLKQQRREQIHNRLFKAGWTECDVIPSPRNAVRWANIVEQPKIVTEYMWSSVYPQLLPLLRSNRSYHESVAKALRRRLRIQRLDELFLEIRQASPPLVRVVRRKSIVDQPDADDYPLLEAAERWARPGGQETKVAFPFPNLAEIFTWPMIAALIEDDISPDVLQERFVEIREEFDEAVWTWRDKIEGDLVEMWEATKDDSSGDPASDAPECADDLSMGGSYDQNTSDIVVTFTKPDGTITSRIDELPPNQQILLRADVLFKCATYGFVTTYPSVVPVVRPLMELPSYFDHMQYGKRWKRHRVSYDAKSSNIAKHILASLNRSGATTAEMKNVGLCLQCGRCNIGMSENWSRLASPELPAMLNTHLDLQVDHYSRKHNEWEVARKAKTESQNASLVYNNVHGFSSSNAQPLAFLMTPIDSLTYSLTHLERFVGMKCLLCAQFGLRVKYHHVHELGLDSPIILHIQEEHDIDDPLHGVHYEPSNPEDDWILLG
ncbi:hypothetical protein RhiJN_15002 [Ceratobasidium sp. AG-Ba]|nr:hypothetical protein RhiJN_15002 [Ceratobasidium sp. AG-Ba]